AGLAFSAADISLCTISLASAEGSTSTKLAAAPETSTVSVAPRVVRASNAELKTGEAADSSSTSPASFLLSASSISDSTGGGATDFSGLSFWDRCNCGLGCAPLV